MNLRLFFLPALSAVSLLGAPCLTAGAAFDAFVKFGSPAAGAPAYVGDSPDPQFNGTNGWSEVVGFDQGAVNPSTVGSVAGGAGAGRARLNEITLIKPVDRGSPTLFEACAIGGHYGAAQLALRERGSLAPGTEPFSLAKLEVAVVTGIQWSSGGGFPTLAFGALQWTLRPTDEASASAATTVNWDQAFNRGGLGPLPGITLLPGALPGGKVGTAYTRSFTASGGVAPYHYMINGGVLPNGLTLSAEGRLSGTPTNAGSFTFRIAGSDDNACFAEQTYTVLVSNNCTARFAGITAAGLTVVLRLEGAAGCRYQVEAADAVTGPWRALGAAFVLPADGAFEVVDASPAGPRFYRAALQP